MLRLTGLLVILLSLGVYSNAGQEEPLQAPAEDQVDFVSGTVSDLPQGKVTVNRAVAGKPAENRTFIITEETQIEGTLRVHARVTVGFKPSEEGDPVAVRIIVRPQSQKP